MQLRVLRYFLTFAREENISAALVCLHILIFDTFVMLEEGLGYALCLDKLVNISGNSALCFRPLLPKLESGLDIVWKKHQVFSKAAELLLKRMQDTFQQKHTP